MNETGFMVIAGIVFALAGTLLTLIGWGHILMGFGIGIAVIGALLLILVNLPSLPRAQFRKAGRHE